MKRNSIFVMLLMAMLMPWAANAQTLADYNFSTGDQSQWIDLSNATTLVQAKKNDVASSMTNIGFSFQFGSEPYTQFWVNDNGIFSFSNNPLGTANANQFNTSNITKYQPKICGISRNMSTGAGGYVEYELTGTEPNRVLVCEYKLHYRNIGYTSGTDYVTWQVQLHESDSKVVIVYGPVSQLLSAYQIGLSTASDDLVLINPSNNEATHYTEGQLTSNSNVWPVAGRYYQFVPSSCIAPTLSVDSETIGTDQATLEWNETATSWVLEYGTTSDFTGATPNTIQNTPTLNLTGLSSGTTYFARVKSVCGDNDESGWSNVVSFTTECEVHSIPYTENFNSYTSDICTGTDIPHYDPITGEPIQNDPFTAPSAYPNHQLPNCWSFLNMSASNTTFPQAFLCSSSDYAVTGNCLIFRTSPTTPLYAILPEFDRAISDLQLTFTYRNRGSEIYIDDVWIPVVSEYDGTLYVGYMTDPTDASTFTSVYTCEPTPEKTTITATNFTDAPVDSYMALKYVGNTWENYALSIDDLSVELAPSSTFTKDITTYTTTGGYYLIASPLAGETDPTSVTNLINTNENEVYDLYYFNQSASDGLEWINYKGNDGGYNLANGKGYLYANSEAAGETVTLTFTGTAYNGNGEVTLAYDENAAFAGWNLVGNPFGQSAYIDKAFYTMNGTSTDLISNAAGTEIHAMEGIFVIASSNNETLTFSTTAPTKGSMVAFNLSNGNGLIDRAVVNFGEGRTLPKFQLNRSHTKVYIPLDGKDYSVVSSEENGEMPVNFKAEEHGTYTLSFNTENVEFGYLHLIDNMTGANVDLLSTPSYSFEAKTTDYESRFRLVFSTDNATEDNFAFSNGNEWVINNEGEATLQVIDMMGRIIRNESINGNANVNLNEATGVYVIRLVNGSNVKVQKVVVK